MSEEFYNKSFSRNFGILTEEEQAKLKNSTVAIAGAGGVGGIAAERLARVGIGNLSIADPEVFEESNINRQFASSSDTIGVKKVDAVGDAIQKINPSLKIKKFPEGMTPENINDFFDGADLLVEEIEFFFFKERIMAHRMAKAKGIFSMTAHSIGFGSPIFIFDPKGMSFEEFYKMPKSEEEFADYQFPFERVVLNNPDYANPEVITKVLKGEMSISTLSLGCSLAASLITAEVVSLLLGKKETEVVPKCMGIDLFKREIVHLDFSK